MQNVQGFTITIIRLAFALDALQPEPHGSIFPLDFGRRFAAIEPLEIDPLAGFTEFTEEDQVVDGLTVARVSFSPSILADTDTERQIDSRTRLQSPPRACWTPRLLARPVDVQACRARRLVECVS